MRKAICFFFNHKWAIEWHGDDRTEYTECVRCGKISLTIVTPPKKDTK